MIRRQFYRGSDSIVFVLVLLLGAFLASIIPARPVAAASDVFWANASSNAIGHANKDGSNVNNVNQTIISGCSSSRGVTSDIAHVYWTNYGTGKIGRANLDGGSSDQSFISGCSGPDGIAVDANYVYWANYATGNIGRANLDGGSPNQSFISGCGALHGIAVDANYVYWTNAAPGKIGRASLDGTNVAQNFITNLGDIFGIAVDANYVYWTNGSKNKIGRANLDGTNVNPSFISGCSLPFGIAVDASYVYWTNDGTGKIGRAKLDGSGVNQSLITGCSGLWGISTSRIILSIQSFMADPVGGVPPLDVTFTCNALAKGGSIAEYHWDFDNDGTVDEVTLLNTTQHIYSAGTYNAKVSVVDNIGEEVTSKAGQITVVSGVDLTGRFSELHWYDTDNRVSLQFDIKNIGDMAAGAFYTYFYLSDDGVKLQPYFRRIKITGLAVGASTTFYVDYIPTTTQVYGKYIVVKIDPVNQLNDIYRINNSTKAAIIVSKPKWP
jgi:virginiamycin B lyase